MWSVLHNIDPHVVLPTLTSKLKITLKYIWMKLAYLQHISNLSCNEWQYRIKQFVILKCWKVHYSIFINNFIHKFCSTLGILVIPPTKITSWISDFFTSASLIAFLQGSTVLLMRSDTKLSNLDLVNFIFKCFGPLESTVR